VTAQLVISAEPMQLAPCQALRPDLSRSAVVRMSHIFLTSNKATFHLNSPVACKYRLCLQWELATRHKARRLGGESRGQLGNAIDGQCSRRRSCSGL
jgi:hypothetical protein